MLMTLELVEMLDELESNDLHGPLPYVAHEGNVRYHFSHKSRISYLDL